MKLNALADRAGSRHARKRVGRGIGSGTGKTSARGQKGQGARAGVAIRTFEGGQMPLHRRLPMRGFKNPTRKDYAEVNLGRLQAAVDAGRLDPKATIDGAALIAAGILRRTLDGLRVLADGELKVALTIVAAGASRKAIETVAKLGGTLNVPPKAPEPEARKPKGKAAKRAEAAAKAKAKASEAKAETGEAEAKPKAKAAKSEAGEAEAKPKAKAAKSEAGEAEAKPKAKAAKAEAGKADAKPKTKPKPKKGEES